MDLTVPVLVSQDRREVYSVQVPGLSNVFRTFRGPSLARLLDDLTLELMEQVPRLKPEDATRLAFSPYVELRRIKTQLTLGKGRNEFNWKGRVPVILDRWPKERFLIATLPYLDDQQFAVDRASALPTALARYLIAWVEHKPERIIKMDAAVCRAHDYLELLTVDVDLPSILPSQPKKLRKKKRSKDKKRDENKSKPKKRELVPPHTLSTVADNLTHRSIDGRLDRAFFRDALIEDLVQHLDRDGAALLLVGPTGVGKTAILHEIVRRLVEQSTSVTDRRDVWQVDGNRIIAGMSVVGAWEHRVTEMVNELNARQDVLFVNDLPALVYTGQSAHSDTNVAGFLEPHLARGEIRLIGECTAERLSVLQDEAQSFFARFRVVQVPEMSEEDALHVLLHVVRRLDRDQPLAVDPEALETTVALTRRFRALDVFPGKAVDLLSRAIADRTEVVRDDFGRRRISRLSVVQHFARQAGLPEFLLFGRGGPTAKQVRKFFERRIVGQPEAVDASVDVITTVSQALNDPARPIATMLFVGPTGVGKTETAKAIADYLFGSKHRMIRFDMSEFQHPDAVARLIGDRFRPDGELTRRVQQQPFSLILLDEIEKAHPAVFDAMLQVLGEGRLTNAAGQTVNFTSTVVVMTSNLGVRDAEKQVGFGDPTVASLSAHYRGAAERFFRPEFFNRIDRVVAFRPLDRHVIVPLVARLLSQMLGRQGLKRSSVLVDVDPALVEVLVDQGFDRRYGARSVKRILEQRLAVPLSHQLVEVHSADLRLVEVYPHHRDLGMAVQVPERRTSKPVRGSKSPTNWKQVEARHAGLRLALDAIAERPDVARYASEQSQLLDALNDDALTEAGQGRLSAISTVQDQLSEIAEAIDRFEDSYLRVEQFILESKTELVVDRDSQFRTTQTDHARIQRADRGPMRADIGTALEHLELHAARVDHQLQALGEPHDDRVLLRFTSDGDASIFYTLRTWLSAWGQYSDQSLLVSGRHIPTVEEAFYRPWGHTARVFVADESGWRELRVGDNDDPAGFCWQLSSAPQSVRSAALWLRGRGLRPLIEPELGLWIWRHEVGPDYQLDVVRVEDVGDDGEPLERLSAVDASEAAFGEARRRGEVDGGAHANAPILRWFTNNRHRCEETGVLHTLESNRFFLQQVVLRRLHAAMMTRVLAGGPRG